MSKLINDAKKYSKFLTLKKQIEFLNEQLNSESEVYNPALEEAVTKALSYSAFSLSLVDLQTIIEVQEDGSEKETKILVVGKTLVFDRPSSSLVSSELYTKAEYNDKQQACFSTEQILSSFYYKNSAIIDKYEQDKKEADKKQKQEDKKKKKQEEAEQKKQQQLEAVLKLEEAKKQQREQQKQEANERAEQQKQEAKDLLQQQQQELKTAPKAPTVPKSRTTQRKKIG